MAIDVSKLSEFVDKRVILHVIQDDGSLAEREGKVEAASEAGMAFKEKGTSGLDLIMPDKIEEIEVAPEKPKKVSQRKMKPVEKGNVRQHLADRHGYTLEQVNAMTEDEAEKVHNEIDHSKLAHRHEAQAQTERDKALADDESNAA